MSRIYSALNTESRPSSHPERGLKKTNTVFWTLHIVFCCLIVRPAVIVHAVQFTDIGDLEAVTLVITAFTQSSGWYSSQEYAVKF